ncbi:MAG: hypothetical protein WCR55_09690 [Lentisphaerota bacterium]
MKINTQAIKKVFYSLIIFILVFLSFFAGIGYYSTMTSSQESFKNRAKELAVMRNEYYARRVNQSEPINDFTYMNCNSYDSVQKESLTTVSIPSEKLSDENDQSSMHREYPESTPYGVELASRIYNVVNSIMN